MSFAVELSRHRRSDNVAHLSSGTLRGVQSLFYFSKATNCGSAFPTRSTSIVSEDDPL